MRTRGNWQRLRHYAKPGAAPGPAVLYAHGGGMIMGSLDLYDEVISWYVDQTDVPFVSVGYRCAPDATGTTLTEDVFAGLTWMISHANELDADPGRIAVMGDSGGGGLGAGAALAERDDGDLSLMERTLPPGGRRPPPHRHTNCSEAYFVLDGQVLSSSRTRNLPLGPKGLCWCLAAPPIPSAMPGTLRHGCW